MKDNIKTTSISLVIAGILAFGAYDGMTVSDAEFTEAVPMVDAKDPKGQDYGEVSKDISKYDLNQMEEKFAQEILEGNGPTGQGELSVKEVQELYFDTAIEMGLTPQDVINGVNLYEFIRK